MSISLVDKAGLRWWTEEEIQYRNMAFDRFNSIIQKTLKDMNRAWEFHRCEAPMLVPTGMISDEYTNDDVFFVNDTYGMRPETTDGSYKYARHLKSSTKIKYPLCVYQMGKSYRVEKADGASASKYRYNEFTQAEWQCIYSDTTMADYRTPVMEALTMDIIHLSGSPGLNIIDSDRLPSYSESTKDIMIDDKNFRNVEVASVSIRNDFEPGTKVLEIAIGMDRLVDIRKL